MLLASLGASAVAARTAVPPAAPTSTVRPRAAPAAMQMPNDSWTWEDECGIEQIGALERRGYRSPLHLTRTPDMRPR